MKTKTPLHALSRTTLAAALSAALLSGCGPGGSSDKGTGTLSLAITDGAADSAAEVWVQFKGVTVKPASGNQIGIEFEQPMNIDLLTLGGANSAALLQGQEFEAGRYNWIRLDVNADLDGNFDSYVLTDSGQMIELEVTSQTGLKLVSGFTITQNQDTSFVVDWDLRRGLTAPASSSGWKLSPALRIIDETEYGSLSGTVDEALLMDASCTNNLGDDTGNAVYVFEGGGVTPDDIDQGSDDPIATGDVKQQQDATYAYSIAYLSPGDYTVALTCQALDDRADEDDPIVFAGSADATIADGEETVVDFN